jgi:hypothetical protein
VSGSSIPKVQTLECANPILSHASASEAGHPPQQLPILDPWPGLGSDCKTISLTFILIQIWTVGLWQRWCVVANVFNALLLLLLLLLLLKDKKYQIGLAAI